jgi:histone H4
VLAAIARLAQVVPFIGRVGAKLAVRCSAEAAVLQPVRELLVAGKHTDRKKQNRAPKTKKEQAHERGSRWKIFFSRAPIFFLSPILFFFLTHTMSSSSGLAIATPGSQQSGPVASATASSNALPVHAFRGKGGKGGKGGKFNAARFGNVGNLPMLTTNATIRTQAMKGGCKRFSGLSYHTAKAAGAAFMKMILNDALTYSEHRRAKTVNLMDVTYSLWHNDNKVYGATDVNWMKDGKI